MRNKKEFSFNEEKDAEWVIINGFPNDTLDYNTMYLVAKYFRKNFGYGAVRLERELIRFCQINDYTFNSIVEADIISKWINSAMNYTLRKVDNIIISQKEIEFLKQIEHPKDRRILFVTLAFSKALKKGSTRINKDKAKKSNNYYIRYNNFLDIIKISEFSNMGEIELAKFYHKYKDLFYFYNPEKELIKLLYADGEAKDGFIIKNPNRIIECYKEIFGEQMTKCTSCGKEFEKKSNRQKYCNECSLRNKREKTRNRVNKLRKTKM